MHDQLRRGYEILLGRPLASFDPNQRTKIAHPVLDLFEKPFIADSRRRFFRIRAVKL
jgi:hypothetical protein